MGRKGGVGNHTRETGRNEEKGEIYRLKNMAHWSDCYDRTI